MGPFDASRGERAGSLGARVLASVGSESEAKPAFAGLYELLRPITGRPPALPGRAAAGAGSGVRPCRRSGARPVHGGPGSLQLVCAAADVTSLILIVDDAHWVDRSSLAVLTFIARRPESEPIAGAGRVVGIGAPYTCV
jgi:hypothetical protein